MVLWHNTRENKKIRYGRYFEKKRYLTYLRSFILEVGKQYL
jgi:hypothetical protein